MNEQNKQTNQLLQEINLKITLQPDKTNERKKYKKQKKPNKVTRSAIRTLSTWMVLIILKE